ncbi:MAG: CotH kinase family protein [Bacteroidota bacterium]
MKMIFIKVATSLILCSGTLGAQNINHWETAVYNNDIWKYFVGISEPDPGWRSLAFNDTLWIEGAGGFGYGDNDDGTTIPSCISVFLRRKFNVTDTAAIASAILNMDYDDAFVAYLNDVEIARVGISGVHPAYSQTGNDHEAAMYRGGYPESFIINKDKLKIFLMPGENILAVQVHNTTASSSDMTSNIILSFSITNTMSFFGPVPSWFIPPGEFRASSLPVVVINTQPDEIIMDEPKITADMKIIHNGGIKLNYITDPGNIYSGKIGIEIRGRYSASLPQKPYGIETRDAAGNNLNVPILGMPPENDWILLPNYNDKTFMRNYLAFEIFREMGHYSTRSRYCEVVVNDEYQGIYLLTEKIKIDKGRVSINDMSAVYPVSDFTGGYIIKNDFFTSGDSWISSFSPINKPGAEVHFVFHDPDPYEMTQEQKNYIQDYVYTFETVLYSPDYRDKQTGYRAFLDVSSFVDYFIVGEVTRNVDAYKKSRFYYKDKEGIDGRIYSGPVWDFDWAWKNITENCIHFNQTDGSGWAYRINECDAWPVPPSWEVRLMKDKNFINEVHDRYYLLRKNILSQSHLNHIIDSVATLLSSAQVRHYEKWKILGINVGTPESGEQPATYSGEIQKFKAWIGTRLAWLDANMPGRSFISSADYKPTCRVFPNPAGEIVYFESDTLIRKITLYNSSGMQIEEKTNCSDYWVKMNLPHTGSGFYIARIYFWYGGTVTRKIVKK